MPDALVRRIGLGITLGMDPLGGVTYVTLGAIVDGFEHDGVTLDVADMSILSDKYKTKATGQADPGKITLTIAYDPTALTTTAARLAAVIDSNAAGNTVPQTFEITYPAVGTEVAPILEPFAGYVTKMGRSIKKDKLVIAPVEITLSGDPGMAGK
jgi:hypothetical protein